MSETKLQVPNLTEIDWLRLIELSETATRLSQWLNEVRDSMSAILGVKDDYTLPPLTDFDRFAERVTEAVGQSAYNNDSGSAMLEELADLLDLRLPDFEAGLEQGRLAGLQVEIPDVKRIELKGEARNSYESRSGESGEARCVQCHLVRHIALFCKECSDPYCGWCASEVEVTDQHCLGCSAKHPSSSENESTIYQVLL